MLLELHEEAIKSFNLVIKYKTDYAEAYAGKGAALEILGRHQEATETCNAAIKYVPGYAESYSTEACTKRLD